MLPRYVRGVADLCKAEDSAGGEVMRDSFQQDCLSVVGEESTEGALGDRRAFSRDRLRHLQGVRLEASANPSKRVVAGLMIGSGRHTCVNLGGA